MNRITSVFKRFFSSLAERGSLLKCYAFWCIHGSPSGGAKYTIQSTYVLISEKCQIKYIYIFIMQAKMHFRVYHFISFYQNQLLKKPEILFNKITF